MLRHARMIPCYEKPFYYDVVFFDGNGQWQCTRKSLTGAEAKKIARDFNRKQRRKVKNG